MSLYCPVIAMQIVAFMLMVTRAEGHLSTFIAHKLPNVLPFVFGLSCMFQQRSQGT